MIINSYAHDTKWRNGTTGPDDYGPSKLYPWEGSNNKPAHSRMNLSYWQHYDQVMTSLADRGIQAHMLVKVYNKSVNWCMAQPGREYIVFHNEAQPFKLKIDGATSTLKAHWFNPLTGNRTATGDLENGEASLTPPENWGKAPLVLHVMTREDTSK